MATFGDIWSLREGPCYPLLYSLLYCSRHVYFYSFFFN